MLKNSKATMAVPPSPFTRWANSDLKIPGIEAKRSAATMAKGPSPFIF